MHDARLLPLLREDYDHAGLNAIETRLAELGCLKLPALPCGLYSAVARPAAGTEYTGYRHVWIRDSVQVAHAAWERGDLAAASSAANGLLRWAELEAPRFEAGIAGEADLADPMQRPHVRFDGEAFREAPGWWPHAQNDALGYALWFLARAALAGLTPVTSRLAAALARFPAWFRAVRYWEDADSGHWEETRKLSCSSVGTALAGLVALRGLLRARPELLAVAERRGEGPGAIAELIEAGRATLDRMLPWESRGPFPAAAAAPAGDAGGVPRAPGVERRADAALLFLLHPLRVVRGEQADAILAEVEEVLAGPWGIRRYVGDSYWMADYKRLFDEQTRTAGFEDDTPSRDRHLKPGTEAQWCLFDPLLATIHAWRAASGDRAERRLAFHHWNRALGQITGEDCPLGAGLCPEAYYLEDSGAPDRWVANDDTPLLWTSALLAVAQSTIRQVARA